MTTSDHLYRQGKIHFDTGRYAEAAPLLKAAAEAGHADAQGDFGYLFRAGLAVEQDWTVAELWYRRAAEQGHADSCHNLVQLLLERDGMDAVPEALQWLKVNAAEGYGESLLQLGHFYRRGTGVEPDLSEALRLFRAAAAQGVDEARELVQISQRYGAADHRGPYPTIAAVTQRAEAGDAAAMRLLGAYSMLGYGGGADSDAARMWIERAAEAGDVPARRALGLFVFDENPVLACSLWGEAAANGDAGSMYLLALSCFDGQGAERDPQRAIQLLEAAAEKGHVDALVVLGDHYRVADQIPRDMERAAHWYKRAAEAGHAEAQWHLAQILTDGHGVAADVGLGLHWMESSAKLGWADAQCALGVHFLQGDGLPVDNGLGTKWVRAAAEQKHAHGMFVLGLCYQKGLGVPADTAFAVHCWRKAAAHGHSQASSAIAAVESAEVEAPCVTEHNASNVQVLGADEPEARPGMRVEIRFDDEPVATEAEVEPLDVPADEVIETLVRRERWANAMVFAVVALVAVWIGGKYVDELAPYSPFAGWAALAAFAVGAAFQPTDEKKAGAKALIELRAKDGMAGAAMFALALPVAIGALYVHGPAVDEWTTQATESALADESLQEAAEEVTGTRLGLWKPGSLVQMYAVVRLIRPVEYSDLTPELQREIDWSHGASASDWKSPDTMLAMFQSSVASIPVRIPATHRPADYGSVADVLESARDLELLIGYGHAETLRTWGREIAAKDAHGLKMHYRFFFNREQAEAYHDEVRAASFTPTPTVSLR